MDCEYQPPVPRMVRGRRKGCYQLSQAPRHIWTMVPICSGPMPSAAVMGFSNAGSGTSRTRRPATPRYSCRPGERLPPSERSCSAGPSS